MAECGPLDDAAKRALSEIKASKVEYFTALTCKDGTVLTAHPETDGNSEHGRVKLRLDGGLVAIIHNHPATGKVAAMFSPEDKAQARRLKVPSYIITADGQQLRYDPLTNKTEAILDNEP